MYYIKTRNFNASPTAARMLKLSALLGANSDGQLDAKYYLSTSNALKAWAAWAYFMAIGPLSGGWTYIIRPGHELGPGYKSIY